MNKTNSACSIFQYYDNLSTDKYVLTSSSSKASPVKYRTARGTILSRIKWPISKSAANKASVSSSGSSPSGTTTANRVFFNAWSNNPWWWVLLHQWSPDNSHKKKKKKPRKFVRIRKNAQIIHLSKSMVSMGKHTIMWMCKSSRMCELSRGHIIRALRNILRQWLQTSTVI